jgi:hypothetical protein
MSAFWWEPLETGNGIKSALGSVYTVGSGGCRSGGEVVGVAASHLRHMYVTLAFKILPGLECLIITCAGQSVLE